MYKKKYPKPIRSEKSKAKTKALLNELEALFDRATIKPNEKDNEHTAGLDRLAEQAMRAELKQLAVYARKPTPITAQA